MAVGPSALPASDSEDRGGGGRGHVRPRFNARRTQGRLRSMGPGSRPDNGRGRALQLRPASQSQSVNLAENGAARDLTPQVAGDLGGGPTLSPEVRQARNPVFGPDGGGHDEIRGQRARSARPRPPFLRPPFLRPPWACTTMARRGGAGPERQPQGPDQDQNGMSSFRSVAPAVSWIAPPAVWSPSGALSRRFFSRMSSTTRRRS